MPVATVLPAAMELPADREETIMMGVFEVSVVVASKVIPFTLLPALTTVPAAKTLPGSTLLPAARVDPDPSTVLPAKADPAASFDPAVRTVLAVTIATWLRVTPFRATAAPFKTLPGARKLPTANSLFWATDMLCPIKVVPFTMVTPSKVVFPAMTTVPLPHCP